MSVASDKYAPTNADIFGFGKVPNQCWCLFGKTVCWNTQPSFNYLTTELVRFTSPSSFTSFTKALIPWAAKHHTSIILPPPCLTVGKVLLQCSLKASTLHLQTYVFSLWPKSSIFVLSDQRKFPQKYLACPYGQLQISALRFEHVQYGAAVFIGTVLVHSH